MKNWLSVPLFLSVFLSCGEASDKLSLKTIDTVQINNPQPSFKIKYPELTNNYYSRFGIIIPKYYNIYDSLPIDLNRDALIDTLVILEPVSLTEEKYYNSNIESAPHRLLIEVINDNGKSVIRNRYSNLLSNIGGVLSKYSGIYITNEGFKIEHESGSRYSWHYTTEFSTEQKDSLTLSSIIKLCSFDTLERAVEYTYSNLPLKNFYLPDTIAANCTCDSIWLDLEKLE